MRHASTMSAKTRAKYTRRVYWWSKGTIFNSVVLSRFSSTKSAYRPKQGFKPLFHLEWSTFIAPKRQATDTSCVSRQKTKALKLYFLSTSHQTLYSSTCTLSHTPPLFPYFPLSPFPFSTPLAFLPTFLSSLPPSF